MDKKLLDMLSRFEGEVEFKAVLPPSRALAKIIASIANTDNGVLIIGLNKSSKSEYEMVGVGRDYYINSIVNKAISFLDPQPIVRNSYLNIDGKQIYKLEIDKSSKDILFESKIYIRENSKIVLKDAKEMLNIAVLENDFLNNMIGELHQEIEKSTYAKKVLIEHYIGILKIFNDFSRVLFPEKINIPTHIHEGKILVKMLFSSAVDNFELYLSQLLYEIYLAKPQTLKSKQEVTIEEVLACSDMDEFIQYIANEKINKLQKGSVRGFINDNKQIKAFREISKEKMEEIEQILQIRHLYTHKNGIVDEKFISMCSGDFKLKDEHLLSIEEYSDKMKYLFELVKELDLKCIEVYKLSIE